MCGVCGARARTLGVGDTILSVHLAALLGSDQALTSSVLPVLVGSDTPGPSLKTMLSGPQDWSFGGEAKPSCVGSATPRRQSAKPQWDVGVGPRSTSIWKF